MKHTRGGCICGATRYEIVEEPITFLACHCSDCQTITGSGFVLALRVPYQGIGVLKGAPLPFERTEADSRRRIIHRCPSCLTALWSEKPDSKEYVSIYAGTLDDSPKLRPVAHISTREALGWISFPDDVLLYEENPPDIGPIVEAWAKRNRG